MRFQSKKLNEKTFQSVELERLKDRFSNKNNKSVKLTILLTI